MALIKTIFQILTWVGVCGILFYLVSVFTDRALENKANKTLQLVRYVARTFLILVMVMATILNLDANLSSVAGLGIAASFMMQDAAKNFFAGLRHISRSGTYRGQVIEVNHNVRLYGRVKKIDASAITLRTPNHNDITIANGDVFSIINYTSEHTTRTDTKMYLDGSPSLWQWEHAEAVMMDELEKVAIDNDFVLHPDEVAEFVEEQNITGMDPESVRPQVIDSNILGGGEQYVLRVFVTDPMMRPEIQSMVRNRIRKRLQAEGISVGLTDNVSLTSLYEHTQNSLRVERSSQREPDFYNHNKSIEKKFVTRGTATRIASANYPRSQLAPSKSPPYNRQHQPDSYSRIKQQPLCNNPKASQRKPASLTRFKCGKKVPGKRNSLSRVLRSNSFGV